MKFEPLPQSFYEPSAAVVAPRLLGNWLVRKTAHGFCGGPIVETEAYLVDDPASHGFSGETARNRVMYGPAGRAYVYLIYGCHFCVNTVCHSIGMAEGVLIRAIEVEFGEQAMRRNRPAQDVVSLTNGPGKLCAALQIDRRLDGVNLCQVDSEIFVALNPNFAVFRRERGPVTVTTRVGIQRAAHLPLRFYLEGSRFISRRAWPLSQPPSAPSEPLSRRRSKS